MSVPAPEFSRPFPLAQLTAAPEHVSIAASAAECRRLADRCGLLGLAALNAELDLRRGPLGEVEVAGALVAQVTQECVVTLEPFTATVEDRFDLRFAPGPAPTGDLVIEAGAEEPPEPLEGDALDLGEIVAGQLALALDPHPRAGRRTAGPDGGG